MIRKLRHKIVIMMMLALTAMIVLINGSLYFTGAYVSAQMSETLLRDACELFADVGDWGFLPERVTEGRLLGGIDATLCALTLDGDGNVVSTTNFLGAETPLPKEAVDAILLDTGRESGYGQWGDYHYYQAVRGSTRYIVVGSSAARLHRVLWTRISGVLLVLTIPVLALMLLLCVWLSRFAVRPARDAIQKQQRFLSDAGHELKTPLSAIAVNAAVLAEEVGPNRYLDCIREEAQRMGTLLRRMMDVARMEVPQNGKLQKQEVDLSALIYQAVLPFESLAYERDIRYVLDIQDRQVCQGDPDLLRQVAAILLDNAFKYVDDGGTVRVHLGTSGKHTVLEVANTGLGISAEDLPHVFERFYRCDKARPDDGSYGLGLSIAQEIMEMHKGELTVESEPGGWTRFRMVL
nr:HAMP domain-containing sensor histidine kinase [uncultured Oscillibacter sp.]